MLPVFLKGLSLDKITIQFNKLWSILFKRHMDTP